jgi:hypothetical protein
VKLRISGGYSDYVRAGLVDVLGHDLTTATLKVGLFLEGHPAPAAGDPGWKTPDAIDYPAQGRAEVRLLVSESSGYTVGARYWFWCLAVDNPTATPVAAGNGVVELV